MSIYDDISNNRVPLNENDVIPSFETEFVQTFLNMPMKEMKKLIKLDPQNEKLFNYIFKDKKYIDKMLFTESENISPTMNLRDKIDVLVDYIEKNHFKIITEKSFLEVLKLFTSDNLGLSESEVKDVLFDSFDRYQIDLTDNEEKNQFKTFLLQLLQ